MQSVIKIGSRESQLAVRQAEIIRDQIISCDPGITVEIITMKTTGDKILDKSLEKIGGKGLFVKELDRALMDGRIDIAVHSLKDMPMEENPDLPILAYGRREDPRDVILYYPGCTFRGIRGNVQTRMRKLETEGYDATLLAAAGLKRLGMEHVISRYFSVDEMIPAAGQGILAVQGRKGEQYGWTDKVDIPQSRAAALAERQFIRVTGGDCTSPCAAHAQVIGNELKLMGLYYNEDTEEYSVDVIVADTSKAGQAGETLAERMMRESRQ